MADAATPPRPRRLWRILLAVSLAFNLAIVGLAVGFAVRDDGRHTLRGASATLGPIGAALSGPERRAVIREVRSQVDMRGARTGSEVDEVVQALTVTPFDRTMLEAAFAEGKARRDAVVDVASMALVDYIAQMSDAERADLATRINDSRRKGKSRSGG